MTDLTLYSQLQPLEATSTLRLQHHGELMTLLGWNQLYLEVHLDHVYHSIITCTGPI